MFSVLATAWFTRGLLRNDNRRMQRRDLTIEPSLGSDPNLPEGWKWYYCKIRNHEDVSAKVTAARLPLWGAKGSWDQAEEYDADFGTLRRPNFDKATRLVPVYAEVAPKGTQHHPQFGGPSATAHLRIAVHGVRSARQVRIIWNWADR